MDRNSKLRMRFHLFLVKSWRILKSNMLRIGRFLRSLVSTVGYVDVESAERMIRQNVVFRGPNVLLLACAIVVASLGLNVNSIPVIIGAMLISPLMGPILGFGLGLGIFDMQLLRFSLKNFLVMVSISLVASSLYFTITPLQMDNPSELLARTYPTIYDVLIAFVGGAAGIIETARKERGTVIAGVAIATALMPPLCTVGYGIAQQNWQYALGAFYLFSINCIFIALATFLGVKYMRFPKHVYGDLNVRRRMKWSMSAAIVLMLVPSVLTAISVVRQNNFSRSVINFVSANNEKDDNYIVDYQINRTVEGYVVGLRFMSEPLSPQQVDSVTRLAAKYGIESSQIEYPAWPSNRVLDKGKNPSCSVPSQKNEKPSEDERFNNRAE